MTKIGKFFASSAVVAVVTVGVVVGVSPAASAHVVCNSQGDCWSTHQRYQYPSTLGIRFYNNRYRSDRYRHRHWHDQRTWRDENHDSDRGYYNNGAWITF
jgi:hypothetical protein